MRPHTVPLSNTELECLLKLVGATAADELSCDECFASIAEFVEHAAAGGMLDQTQRAVAQHLSVCGECQEVYQALKAALDDVEPPADGPA